MNIQKLPELRYALRGQSAIPMNYKIEVAEEDIFDLIFFFILDKEITAVTIANYSGTERAIGEFWVLANDEMYHVHGPTDYSDVTLPWLNAMADCLRPN